MRANSATVRASPRAPGSTPAARSASSALAGEPAQVARAARSVLRRWPKAASITAKTSSRLAVVGGGSRRVNATSLESTFGTGQKTDRGTVPASRAAAYQASLADGTPYTLLPGPAHILIATSACTMMTPRCSDGSAASRCSTTGTDTLYGRLAASTVGAGAPTSCSPTASASAVSTVTRSATSGARSAIVRGSSPASTGSISTATSRIGAV